ncbi:MAG: hypothetical protein NTY03_04140 [Candidatus Bathyarchaeota archaeon]|nr:hypothetical protein [Candidatus Bathyarchaeota archaeon]
MPNFIIKTCWMNKGRNVGLKEYYEVIKKVCKEREGVEFLGLYRPLNDGWNWAYFIKTDNIDKWSELDNEINKLYVDVNDNVTKILTRIYEGSDQLRKPPISKKRDPFNYICEEMMVWSEIDVGLNDYYSTVCEILEEVENIRFLGLYIPWSENYNYTFFHMLDAPSHLVDLENMILRQHGRPENLTVYIIRLYKRFEP